MSGAQATDMAAPECDISRKTQIALSPSGRFSREYGYPGTIRLATAAVSNPQVVPTGQFVDALNDMIDTYEKRLSAGRSHVPPAIFVALVGIAIIAIGFTGYGANWGAAQAAKQWQRRAA